MCKILKVVVTIWTPSGLDNITVSVRVLLSLYLKIITGSVCSVCPLVIELIILSVRVKYKRNNVRTSRSLQNTIIEL